MSATGIGMCLYTHENGMPGCLVGQGFWLIGDRIPWDSGANESGVDDFAEELEVDEEDPRILWLSWAQNRQDQGFTWSQAVSFADAKLVAS